MTKMKKNFAWLLASAILFVSVFCGASAVISAKADSQPSMEVVDTYLLANGYSEEFVESMGEMTKRHLYDQGAIFVSSTNDNVTKQNVNVMSNNDSVFANFQRDITVSDVTTDENVPKYTITYSFTWDSNVHQSMIQDCSFFRSFVRFKID